MLGIGEDRDSKALSAASYPGLVKKTMRDLFPDVKGRKAKRALYRIVSTGAAFMLRERVLADPGLIGRTERIWVPADDDIDMLVKGHIDRNAPESERRVKDDQLAWVTSLEQAGRIEKRFNSTFFTAGDSREPELAGIRGAAVGSFYTLLVTLVLSFSIGVAAAVYLEESAWSRSSWTFPAVRSTRRRCCRCRSSCGRTVLNGRSSSARPPRSWSCSHS